MLSIRARLFGSSGTDSLYYSQRADFLSANGLSGDDFEAAVLFLV
jgi:hypothetical protein